MQMPPKRKSSTGTGKARKRSGVASSVDSESTSISDDDSYHSSLSLFAPDRKTRASAKQCKDKLDADTIMNAAVDLEHDKARHNPDRYDFEHLLTTPAFEGKDFVKKMKPEDFTREYYDRTGLEDVLLFDCPPEELGMRMVDDSFTPRDVERLVGSDRLISCVRVETQTSESMRMKDFVDYYFTPESERKDRFNVLSLEFSNTELADLVQAPRLVREIDWANSWPDSRKQRKVKFKNGTFEIENHFPRVQNYCLMSVEKCYTDFHIDFHGTSVWYHVKKGRKIFWIIPPTLHTIKMYEEYLKANSQECFFGTSMDSDCLRVVVNPGNTLIIPSGWIHSVYTPVDSLVFGGNFLHSRRARMQIQVLQSENRIGIQKRYRYPYSEEAILFSLAQLVKKITGREYIRPYSRNQKNYWLEYIGEQFESKKGHHRIPREEDYKDGGIVWKTNWEDDKEYYDSIQKMMKYETVDENGDRVPAREVTINDHGLEEEAEEEEESIVKKEKEKREEEEKEETKNEEEEGTGKENETRGMGGHDDFFIDHFTFYHPETFQCDAGQKACAMHQLPLSAMEPKMVIDEDALRSLISPGDIPEMEFLLQYLLKKRQIDIPLGITRPNSLLQAVKLIESCLEHRRGQLETEGVALPPSLFKSSAKTSPKKRNCVKKEEDDSEWKELDEGIKRRKSSDEVKPVNRKPNLCTEIWRHAFACYYNANKDVLRPLYAGTVDGRNIREHIRKNHFTKLDLEAKAYWKAKGQERMKNMKMLEENKCIPSTSSSPCPSSLTSVDNNNDEPCTQSMSSLKSQRIDAAFSNAIFDYAFLPENRILLLVLDGNRQYEEECSEKRSALKTHLQEQYGANISIEAIKSHIRYVKRLAFSYEKDRDERGFMNNNFKSAVLRLHKFLFVPSDDPEIEKHTKPWRENARAQMDNHSKNWTVMGDKKEVGKGSGSGKEGDRRIHITAYDVFFKEHYSHYKALRAASSDKQIMMDMQQAWQSMNEEERKSWSLRAESLRINASHKLQSKVTTLPNSCCTD